MAGNSAKEEQLPVKAFGLAVKEPSGSFSPFNFLRRATGEHDVQIKILYCAICYFDTEMIKNSWGLTRYPLVPGHENVGVVTEVGFKVQKFKVGDKVGVGIMARTCRKCENCTNDLGNFCPDIITTDGSSRDENGIPSYGGCSNIIVLNEHFVCRWPENLPMDAGTPLLCAGITAYGPLKNFGLDKPGMHIGVVGLGAIGHLAVKFAKAFGAKVTVISKSINKKQEAIDNLGADTFILSNEPEQMQAEVNTMNGIIDTLPVTHPIAPLINLLKPHGKLILLGAPPEPYELPVYTLLQGGKIVAGSASGGVKQTQEMIDFAAKHSIVSDVEVIPVDYLNTATERIKKGDVKYRFVIDIGNTLNSDD